MGVMSGHCGSAEAEGWVWEVLVAGVSHPTVKPVSRFRKGQKGRQSVGYDTRSSQRAS